MKTKTILITGSTDGIGLETAKMLSSQGHNVLLHGRNSEKLEKAKQMLSKVSADSKIETYTADLSLLKNVAKLADDVASGHSKLDVLINNAGVFVVDNPVSSEGIDIRFTVNTIAPYMLTKQLLPLFSPNGRVINLSSAAQAPVFPESLTGNAGKLNNGTAYAQSKLALTMWSRQLGLELGAEGPAVIAVNPGSMLGSKMVKEAYGVNGGNLRIGADILCRAALSDEFAEASGKYFDNDRGIFASPHPDALDPHKTEAIVRTIESLIQIA